eukprot:1527683-Alexandrium_andersonii.AAC.1
MHNSKRVAALQAACSSFEQLRAVSSSFLLVLSTRTCCETVANSGLRIALRTPCNAEMPDG